MHTAVASLTAIAKVLEVEPAELLKDRESRRSRSER